MLIHILENIINKLESRLEIVLPTKYYRKLCILTIYIFLSYYVHSVESCTLKIFYKRTKIHSFISKFFKLR